MHLGDTTYHDASIPCPGTMLITSLTFALSAWFVHHTSAGKDGEADNMFSGELDVEADMLEEAASWLLQFQAPFNLFFSALLLSDKKDASSKFVIDYQHAVTSMGEIIFQLRGGC